MGHLNAYHSLYFVIMLEDYKHVFLYVSPYLLFMGVNDKTHWLDVCILTVILMRKHSRMLREFRIIGNLYSCSWRQITYIHIFIFCVSCWCQAPHYLVPIPLSLRFLCVGKCRSLLGSDVILSDLCT